MAEENRRLKEYLKKIQEDTIQRTLVNQYEDEAAAK